MKLNSTFFSLLTGLLFTCISFNAYANPGNGGKTVSPLRMTIAEQLKTKKTLQLELFVMSQCPFAIEAEQAIVPILKEFGGKIDFKLRFVASVNGHNQVTSMHGQQEVAENKRQAVIAHYYPQQFLDYLLARSKNYDSEDWKIAARAANIPTEKVERLAASAEGERLLLDAIRPAMEKKVHRSPAILMDGQRYSGGILPLQPKMAVNAASVKAGSSVLDEMRSLLTGTKKGTFSPSAMDAPCGNGIRESDEGCDDGNTNNGDGCSATCSVEPGYACSGSSPSVCMYCPPGLNISAPNPSQSGTTGTWTAPPLGTWKVRITAKGAKGGNGHSQNGPASTGAAGSTMIGDFILNGAQQVEAIAGAGGANGNGLQGGGGGGSGAKVVGSTIPLIIGGGGGGGSFNAPGSMGSIMSGNGQGGGGVSGAGGGGLFSVGENGYDQGFTATGGGFNLGGIGVTLGSFTSGHGGGGYGGGGGGNLNGGGGGGGYSGGAGGAFTLSAGGGGSINYGSNQNNTYGSNNAGGQVIIECLGAATFTANFTATQPVCTNPTQGSLNIDLTGDNDGNTAGLEYAIVAGSSFSGAPTFSSITADPFNITSGFGTIGDDNGETYTVRIRLKYNPTLFIDQTYIITSVSDTDGDGLGDVCDNCLNVPNANQINADGDAYGAACDCDDNNSNIYPGAAEVCDGIDNDCNTVADDGIPSAPCIPSGTPSDLIYNDVFPQSQCQKGQATCLNGQTLCIGFVGPSAEICDGIDNDCDGLVDAADPTYVDNMPPTITCPPPASFDCEAFNVPGQVLLDEDFSDNSAGWTIGTEWAIGSATEGCGDPGTDHTPTSDNGVAGVVIGGCAATSPLHDFYYLTSPVIDASNAGGDLTLSYWRDLWSDYTPYMKNVIQVFNGSAWQTIWETFGTPAVDDASWTYQSFNISAYKNAALQVRFGFNIGSGGAFNRGSWNLDDVKIAHSEIATATDNCGNNNLTINYSDAPGNGACQGCTLINRTWTATDNRNNSAQCVQVLTITDSEPPSVTCKAATVWLDGAGSGSLLPSAVFQGGSDNCGAVTPQSVSPNSFTCNDIGGIQVSLTVVDDAGNPANCTAQVTVLDTIRPNALCQSIVKNLSVDGTVSIMPAEVNNLSNDNCTPVTLVSVSPNSFTCSDVGPQSVTLTVKDAYENTKTCQATVTVQDNTDPTALCQSSLTLNLDASGQASLTATQVNNGSTDNCGIQSLSIDPQNFDCDDVGSNTVTLTVTDVNLRTSTCSTSVNVVDNTLPTANCTAGIILDLGANGQVSLPASQVDNASTDNCGIASLALSSNSFDCSHVGNQQVVLTVTDDNNLVSTCTTLVEIRDVFDPTAICQNITVNLDGVTGEASITGSQLDGGSSDNCSIASFAASPNMFNLSNLGPNSVTLTVTDVNQRTATCQTTVTVTNTNAPNAVCQSYTAVLGANGQVGITPANIDNGSNVLGGIASMSVSPNSFTCDNLGPNQVTLTVIGNNNQQATCQASVTVQDNTKPSVTCKNHTVSLNASGQAGIAPADVFDSGSDNCGTVNLQSVSPNSFTCNNLGTNQVILTVNDGNNNTQTCTATITVQDITQPNLVCKNITVNLGSNITVGITPSQVFDNLLSSDNCGTVNLVGVSPNSFTCGTLGAQAVTLTANDGKGNTNTCTATVTVQDNGAPTPLCRDVVVQLDPMGNASVIAAQVDNGSFDNCALGTLSVSPNTFTLANVGINPVTLTVPDVNNNSSSCTAQVTVENNQLPNAVCQNITRNLNAAGQINLTATDVDGGSTALGGIASMSVSPNLLTCNDLGQTTVVLTVTGNNTKQASCSATVTVQDVTLPTAKCKNISINLDGNGMAGITPEQINDGSTDNCGVVNLVGVSPNLFTCSNLGGNQVTLTVNDGHGNTNSCTATVTVIDNTAPSVTCKNHTVALGANGQAGIVPADVFDNGGDNCGTVNLVSVVPNAFDCSDLGQNQVTLTVNDGHGNSSQCTASVMVQDNTPPVAICQNLTVQLSAIGQASITPAQVNNGTSDNCSFSLSLSQTSFNCSHVGANTVILFATDPSENTHSCTATVTIQDNVAPVALCKNATVFLDATGHGSTTAAAVNNNSTDACGIASLELSETDFDCSELGANPLTLTVTDMNGNTSQCSTTVTVVDNLAPTLVCQNISIQLGANASANIIPAQVFDAAASSDNCGTVNLVSVYPNQFDCGEIGPNTVTLTANDGHGNTITCQATVTVEDFFTNVDVAVTPENCGMSDGSIVVTTDAPGGQVAFSINGGATWQFSGTFNGLPAGTYMVVIQAYGGMGCSSNSIPTVVQSVGNAQTWYKDMDGDGYSDGLTQLGCVSPGAGWYLAGDLTATGGDCNDFDADEFPGQVWYRDMDGDNWSNGQTLVQCSRPWGYKTADETATSGDCNDNMAACYPGAPEICNNLDDDCDGQVDEGLVGLTYVGNVTFSNQAQVNAFSSCYTVIDGNLAIQNAGIDSLGSLRNLRMVTGNVLIKQTGLDHLEWLLELDTIGGSLTMLNNSQLQTLDGLDSLVFIGGALSHHHNLTCAECCAIYDLLNTPGGIGGSVGIYLNQAGCNSVAQVNMECAPNGGNLVGPGSGCSDCGFETDGETVEMAVDPNPNAGRFGIGLTGNFDNGELILYDLTGREVWQQRVGEEQAGSRIDGPATDLRKGLYLLVFRQPDGSVLTERIIVQ